MHYEDYETACLDRIDEKIIKHSEMTREEREFLNGLVRHHKPKKILEIGVSAGASSAILLNAAADYGATVHSVDYLDHWYRDPSKEVGFLIKENLPELATGWHLHQGTIAARFMDEIGSDIDFCLLDTSHENPGEFLDFLMVLPFLKDEAIIVLHDVGLHTMGSLTHFNPTRMDQLCTCGTLFSALHGQRLLPSRTSHAYFANIGAIKLTSGIRQDPWPFFNLLTLPWVNWHYLRQEEWAFLSQFVERHYPPDMQVFFQKLIAYRSMRQSWWKTKRERKMTPGKTVINFVKSYFLFPWYVYKTYKKIG